MRSLDGRKYGKTLDGRYRCNQCRKLKSRAQMTRGGQVRQDCNACKERRSRLYASGMTVRERIEAIAKEFPRKDEMLSEDGPHVIFKPRSSNQKLGPIPVSISEPGTCPTSCSFYNVGCYASYGWNGTVWKKVRRVGMPWAAFLGMVRKLPEKTLWRHNEAGDLPADMRGAIDATMLAELVEANRGRRGFTYTHRRPTRVTERRFIEAANESGFTINLSADTLSEADALLDLGVAPVVVTLPSDAVETKSGIVRGWLSRTIFARTPKGRKVVLCPAQTDKLTCAQCRLCANAERKSVVAFIAHGQGAALVSELVRTKREVT